MSGDFGSIVARASSPASSGTVSVPGRSCLLQPHEPGGERQPGRPRYAKPSRRPPSNSNWLSRSRRYFD